MTIVACDYAATFSLAGLLLLFLCSAINGRH